MKTKWELSDAVDRSLMESILDDEGEIIKQSPAKSVTRHEADGEAFYVKRSRHSGFPLRPQKYWFKECPARWEWRVAQSMHALSIPVVEHLAFCENWSLTGLQEDILITRAFGGQPLHLVEDVDAKSVVRFVNECHEKGMVHGDLHPANILINPTSGELRLADLKGVCLEQEPNPARQKEDLAYLNIHFPMPLSPELLQLSNRLRREKMVVRSRRCLKNNREFGPQSYGNSIWWVRKPMANEALDQVLTKPDSVLRGEKLIKAGRTSTVGQQAGFVVKRYNFKKPLNLLKDFFRPTKARRAFQLGYHLELVDVRTPSVIAVAEHRPLGVALRSYLVMEVITEAKELSDAAHDDLRLAKRLAKLIGRMHAEGFVHRDLKASNVLVDGEGEPWLIDLDGLSYSGSVPVRVAVSNLKRFERALSGKPINSAANRLCFLRNYCRATGFCPSVMRGSQK